MTRLTNLDLPTFRRATIGFDRMFDEMERTFANSATSGYPPYNIAQLEEDAYVISLAVAGFSMKDLSVVHDKNILRIEGTSPEEEEGLTYIHKGVGGRNFRREFALADHVEVEGASLENGMLNVRLKRMVPEELQPKQIEIISREAE